ncbi:MAG: hypothetical protein QF391_15050 [Myxococcota bacterium]|nr:hypothetical protein [Myxococcota bacterium]
MRSPGLIVTGLEAWALKAISDPHIERLLTRALNIDAEGVSELFGPGLGSRRQREDPRGAQRGVV